MKSVVTSLVFIICLITCVYADQFINLNAFIHRIDLVVNSEGLHDQIEIRIYLKNIQISDTLIDEDRRKTGNSVYFGYKDENIEYRVIEQLDISINGKEINIPETSYKYFLNPNVQLNDVNVICDIVDRKYKMIIGCSEGECHHVGEILFSKDGVQSSSASRIKPIWSKDGPTGQCVREEIWRFAYKL